MTWLSDFFLGDFLGFDGFSRIRLGNWFGVLSERSGWE